MVNIVDYMIPVDYESNKVVSDSYYALAVGEETYVAFSAQLARFDAKATRLADNTVEVFINVYQSNYSLWFNHNATSRDEDIFIPQKDTWYFLGSESQDLKSYRFVLPENNVSSDGYVYLSICFNLPFGMHNVGKIKLAIN